MFDSIINPRFAVHGGGDSGGGMAGVVSDILAVAEEFLTLSPAEMFEHLLPGIAAMENIHPLLVHFPIALLTLFFLIDVAGSVVDKHHWRLAASWFLYGGTVFAGLTVAAGMQAAATVLHGDDVHEIMETHEHFGLSILILATLLSMWRLFGQKTLHGALNAAYLCAAGLLCVLLALGADLGGLMVYKYGVAVAAARSAHIDDVATHQHNHGDHVHEH